MIIGTALETLASITWQDIKDRDEAFKDPWNHPSRDSNYFGSEAEKKHQVASSIKILNSILKFPNINDLCISYSEEWGNYHSVTERWDIRNPDSKYKYKILNDNNEIVDLDIQHNSTANKNFFDNDYYKEYLQVKNLLSQMDITKLD